MQSLLLYTFGQQCVTMIVMPLCSWYSVSNIQTEYFLSAAVRFGCQWCKLRNCDVIQICRGWNFQFEFWINWLRFGRTSWGLETLNLFWLLDSHPWLFSNQPMQRGTYWSRKNFFNDNIGTFCFGWYANTWNAFVYMNTVKWFFGPGEVWKLENCNHQPKCLFGRDPLAGVFNCGFSSNWILPYFPTVRPSVRHRRDISHFSHI